MKIIPNMIRVTMANIEQYPAFFELQKSKKDYGKIYFVEWILMDMLTEARWENKIKWFMREREQIKFYKLKQLECAKRMIGGEVL